MGTILEVMDRDNIHRMRVASVTSLVGDRIHVSYVIDPKDDDPGKIRDTSTYLRLNFV